MSLSKVSLGSIVKKLYQFKLRSNIGFFSSLIILQIVAILFSLGGVGQSGRSSTHLELNVHYYSADFVVVFTMIWAFIISIQTMSKEKKETDYLFVTNGIATNLSNVIFLLTVSIISGILAILSGFLLKVVAHFMLDYRLNIGTVIVSDLQLLSKGIMATILFIFIASALGYLVGTLVQLSKIFIVLLPVFLIGIVFISARFGMDGQWNMIGWIFQFYFQESIFLFFFMKSIVTSGLIFLCAILISDRLEAG